MTIPFKEPANVDNFQGAFSTPTVHAFQDMVLLRISGVGQSAAQRYNDAFYVYTDNRGNLDPTPSSSSDYHQLAVSTSPIEGLPGQPTPLFQLAKSKVVFDVDSDMEVTSRPYVSAYSPDHFYSVVVDVGSLPGPLYFAVADGIYADNAGAYSIVVTQLAAVPEPASRAIWSFFSMAGIGCCYWRKRKQ